ncbi:uncharacterized protein TEOVI_000019500 [Trypanosoma equiperdum]|uniref:Uncharacterized protein n=2 Tax=Trypanozoon TaxID=39700 RepID=Q57U78_TRYB2|nr:hypothetical protein, conserved [Trypanosoma brucei brucei TREU927]AAX70841.1 hypothetical protein, conserved [Trypanosoma brucei]AAZ11499.1 hypothetical protein, conserved [Trypanosoma brucei brucei TREU927]SCU65470.1 hypothetical protein, conserved [Trypanosoma equiperdum]
MVGSASRSCGTDMVNDAEMYGGSENQPQNSSNAVTDSTPKLSRWPDGTTFEGPLVDGVPEGHGTCVYKSGCVCVGSFSRGCVEGPAEALLPCGAFFVGNFCRSAAHGHGVLLQNGRLVRGEWRDGVLVRRTLENVNDARDVQFYTRVIAKLCHRVEELNGTIERDSSSVFQQTSNSGLCIREPIVLLRDEQQQERDAVQTRRWARVATQSPPYMRNEPHGAGMPPLAREPDISPRFDRGSFSSLNTHRRQPTALDLNQLTSFARSVLASGASQQAIFASAAPAANEFFSPTRYLQCFFIMLFPFISLPQFSFSPIRRVMLKMEREFVVSGAFLFRSFNVPIYTLTFSTIATCCLIATVVIVSLKVELGPVTEGKVTLEELFIPCILWVAQSALYAAYNSYVRVAHALERLDRRLTPQLYACAAGIVNTKAKVCIFTWDDEGRRVVTNVHYRYRWLGESLFVGILFSLAGPLTRVSYKQPMFGYTKYEVSALVLISASVLVFAAMVTFNALKLTDMQRQIKEQMRALTHLAYVEGKSVMHPSEHLLQRFNLDEPFNVSDIFNGVSGWYVIRSVVVYAASCSNHAARGLAMSVFFMLVNSCFLVTALDMICMLSFHYNDLGKRFSCMHAYGVVTCSVWGILLLRYLYKCVETVCESERHLYLLDVASLYHRTRYNNAEGCADIITTCRKMVKAYEQLPCVFLFPITPFIITIVVILYIVALLIATIHVYFAAVARFADTGGR